MGEQLDYVIDDFLTGGQAHKDHNVNQARDVAGRRPAVRGRIATGDRSRGTRGADYGVVQDTSAGQKQMNEYASYLDTKRRHDALVRGNQVRNDVITFRNQETLNAYRNNRGIMINYEDQQYACDRGVANSCSAVGRAVGDGRNPLASGNEGLLFGWTGGTGRTAPLEPQVAVSRRRPLALPDSPVEVPVTPEGDLFRPIRQRPRPVTSGVDGVPSGGGMIRPQPAPPPPMPDPAPVEAPPIPRGTDITEPQPARTGGVLRPKSQAPRKNNNSGGTKDGRDGTATQSGVEGMEHLSSGFVTAPLISQERDMTSTVMKFEFARPNKYDIGCRYASKEFLSQAL